MTGIERLRAQVYGGKSAVFTLPRAMMRDILRQIESETRTSEDEPRDAWEDGYVARAAEGLPGEGAAR